MCTWTEGSHADLRTGRADFLEIAENLTKVFLDNLSPSGVPWWYVLCMVFAQQLTSQGFLCTPTTPVRRLGRLHRCSGSSNAIPSTPLV